VSETRKIAAILVADVVGYSRLAGADEDRTPEPAPRNIMATIRAAAASRRSTRSPRGMSIN
jgi:class 3 adenylate cyclase